MPLLHRRPSPTGHDAPEAPPGPGSPRGDAGDELLLLPDVDAPTAGGEPARRQPTPEEETTLLLVLEDWARDVLKPDDVAVPGLGSVPLGVVLRRLTVCELPLTPRLAAAVRLEGPATVGEVAEALHHARTHPRGPRCRSYRSALYYLRGMERLDDEADGSNDALLS